MNASRRALLSAAAAPVALATLGGARVAACPLRADVAQPTMDPHLDAGLVRLGQHWTAAREVYVRAGERLDALMDANPRPEAPEAIFFRDADHDFCFHEHTCLRADGQRWYFVGSLDPQHQSGPGPRLRQPIKRPGACVPPYGHPQHGKASIISGMVVWTEAQARADEIVSAFDGWRAEIEAQECTNGIRAAREQLSQSVQALNEIEAAIEDATAVTLVGARVKAQVISHDTRQGLQPSDALLNGLLADLLAMGGAA